MREGPTSFCNQNLTLINCESGILKKYAVRRSSSNKERKKEEDLGEDGKKRVWFVVFPNSHPNPRSEGAGVCGFGE